MQRCLLLIFAVLSLLALGGCGGSGSDSPSVVTSDTDFAISPNGRLVAFRRKISATGGHEIWIKNVDGTNPYRIQSTRTGNENEPPILWSPDNTRVVILIQGFFAPYSSIEIINVATNDAVVIFNERGPITGIPEVKQWTADDFIVFTVNYFDPICSCGKDSSHYKIKSDGTGLAWVDGTNLHVTTP